MGNGIPLACSKLGGVPGIFIFIFYLLWSSLTALEDKVFEIQAQIYDLQNQNYEYELKFSRMGLATECRILETQMSFETGEPLPWKRFARENMVSFNKNKNEE